MSRPLNSYTAKFLFSLCLAVSGKIKYSVFLIEFVHLKKRSKGVLVLNKKLFTLDLIH